MLSGRGDKSMTQYLNKTIYKVGKTVKAKTVVGKRSSSHLYQDREIRTSLVAQWLRIRLPIQGTRVRALGREDPTRRKATEPMHHSY